jgi:hypothetical protein
MELQDRIDDVQAIKEKIPSVSQNSNYTSRDYTENKIQSGKQILQPIKTQKTPRKLKSKIKPPKSILNPQVKKEYKECVVQTNDDYNIIP